MTAAQGFRHGLRTAIVSVFALVLVGTYVSVGALAHDFGFSASWVAAQTVLIWAAPAQVIMITAMGAGASPLEVAIAVGLSAVRLMPMVVALLPILRTPRTRGWQLVITAHFTAASMWIEALRLAPDVPREARIGFANGLGVAFMSVAVASAVGGYFLAFSLPTALVAALLFLTPSSFLIGAIRNSRRMVDWLALAFGLALAPVLALGAVRLDLLWTGLVGGTAAYLVQRLRGGR
ncbi:MAG: AzlC family ABC transporter permease [Proteobacteria bacterium]|nr:AzlC family ABC transporter permease [Pseudomonadota bacterium]